MELSPIEVAIDEMQSKTTELEEVVLSPTIDIKKLQLRLQGAVAVQVNAGPLAYANTFFDPKVADKYDYDKVEDLRDVFRWGLVNFQNIFKNGLSRGDYHAKKCYSRDSKNFQRMPKIMANAKHFLNVKNLRNC